MYVCIMQVERSVLEKEHIPTFLEQMSEVSELVCDNQPASLAAAAERQFVQSSPVAKSEAGIDEIVSWTIGTTSTINCSPPCCSFPSNLLREMKPGGKAEVKNDLMLLVNKGMYLKSCCILQVLNVCCMASENLIFKAKSF